MRQVVAAIAAAASLFAGSAWAAEVVVSAPQYDEAIYGTPDAPQIWETGPILGVTQLRFYSHLSDAQIVALEIANATPGARVHWLTGIVGFVGDDGTFSLSTPFGSIEDAYERQYNVLRVGLPLAPGNSTMMQPFDIVRLGVSGFQPVTAPEPGTWALLILGFAGAGAALRRRARERGWFALADR